MADLVPLVTAKRKPVDYADDFSRGTVDYRLDWKNYSFHAVRIPDQTVIVGANFSQAQPKTAALGLAGVATFIECNLTNCLIPPGATLKQCNTSQSWLVETAEGVTERQWLAKHPDDLITALAPPPNLAKAPDAVSVIE